MPMIRPTFTATALLALVAHSAAAAGLGEGRSFAGLLASGAGPGDLMHLPGAPPAATLTWDTLFVDPACTPPQPPCYGTIQEAVDQARAGSVAVIRVAPALYQERIHVYPTAPAFSALILEAQDPVSPPRLRLTHDPALVKDDEGAAAIEIHNRPQDGATCADLRVAIWGFDVEVAGDGYGSAISVWSTQDDPDQQWNTALDIAGNRIRCEAGGPALVIGLRASELEGLIDQSPKWGWVRNNIISSTETQEGDGVASWKFVGAIANNEIAAASEGWHLGFARTDSRHESGPIPGDFRTATVEHNYFHCTTWNAFHFAHGSVGLFRNNIMTESQQVLLPNQTLSTGLGFFAGPPPTDEPDYPVMVDVHNNVAFANDGSGFMVHEDARVRFGGNSSVGNGWGLADPNAGFGFELRTTGGPADHLLTDFNLLYQNREDYSRPSLEARHDVNEGGIWPDPGGAPPRFVGDLDPRGYSFQLRTAAGPHPCGYDVPVESPAIDAGPPMIPDAAGAGLGGARNDVGAYGGPGAIWDPEGFDPCWQIWIDPALCER